MTVATFARTGSAEPIAGTEPAPQANAVRVVQLPWHALDIGFRVQPGQAQVTSRVLSAGEDVAWAYHPVFEATPSSSPTLLAGGDVGLTEGLTLRLDGAQEFMTLRRSSMTMGLQWHLTSPSSVVQASIFQGMNEGSNDGVAHRSIVSQFALKLTWPALQLGYSLRGNLPLTGPDAAPSLVSTGGAKYAIGPINLGVEHVIEAGRAVKDVRGSRQVIVGSATTALPKSGVEIGVTSSHGLRGTPSVPAKVGVSLGF